MSERASNSRRRTKGMRASVCGGSKGGGSSYDPQVGTAAAQEAATAEQAQNFSQNYYTTTVAPLLAAETAQSQTTTADENQLFGLNMSQAQTAANQLNTYGIPAQDSYYNMVSNYSAPAQQQEQAQAALGDMKTAEASNQATLQRQQRSYGINPTSGNAMALASDASTTNTAAEAAAETRARYNAQQLGMQLTADAANFSNTGVSALASTSSTAGAAAGGALGAAATATGSGNSSASVPLAGYSLANSAYGNNLDAYSRLGAADIQASAQADSALGQGIGSLIGAAGSFASSAPGAHFLGI